MASLFTSCPTFFFFCFHNCPPPSWKKRTRSTQDASRSGLCLTPSAMMRMSGRGRGHTSATLAQSESSAAADWLRLVLGRSRPTRLEKRRRANAANKNDRKKKGVKKIRHNTASLNPWSRTMPHFSWFILFYWTESALAIPLCSDGTQAALFFFFTLRHCFVTTPGDSHCLQVTGSAERWGRVRNELTLGFTLKHLTGPRTHTAARMLAHYPTPPCCVTFVCLPPDIRLLHFGLVRDPQWGQGVRLDTRCWM